MKEINETTQKANVKKRMIIIIVSVFAVLALLLAASYAIDLYNKKNSDEQNKPINYNFYPADYDENIYDDSHYIELISGDFIYYTDNSTNVTLGISTETAKNYGADVEFVVDYIYAIINGDCDKYNGFFSDNYFEKNEKKDRFTMQKLYDVKITKVGSNDINRGDGVYTEYTYTVEYKILKNNGTFRNDIGAGSRKQTLKISEQSDVYKIESISY